MLFYRVQNKCFLSGQTLPPGEKNNFACTIDACILSAYLGLFTRQLYEISNLHTEPSVTRLIGTWEREAVHLFCDMPRRLTGSC